MSVEKKKQEKAGEANPADPIITEPREGGTGVFHIILFVHLPDSFLGL